MHAHVKRANLDYYVNLNIADVWRVPAVRVHMAAEMAGMTKACFTHSAVVRLLASVSAHVNCQSAGLIASV